jgi:hypothetical protein
MSNLTLPEVLTDATCLLESDELTSDETQAICKTIRDLMGRESVLCQTRMQRELFVAKAWATTAGRKNLRGHAFGRFKKMDWADIRAILAEVPAGE